MKKFAIAAAAVGMLAITSSGASAATFGLSLGGTADTLKVGTGVGSYNPNYPLPPGPEGWPEQGDSFTYFDNYDGLSGDDGKGLLLNDLGASNEISIQVSYLGKEAGYTNGAFELGATQTFKTGGSGASTPGDSTNALFTCGPSASCLLDFQFTTSGSSPGIARNGDLDQPLAIGYIIASSTVAYALFDDGGAGQDKDFDDMVLRFEIVGQAVPVPIPAAFALFLSGLMGLGFLGRYRRKKESPAA